MAQILLAPVSELISALPGMHSTTQGFRSRQLITTRDKDVCMFLPLSSVLGFCKGIDRFFDHASVKRIQVRINSTPYLDRELETNFDVASRNYGRAYMMFQEAVQKICRH